MLRLYHAPGPNPRKVAIMLEECGADYVPVPVDMNRGDQFAPEFLRISPNAKIPALIDEDALEDGPVSIFESGAILLHLARKFGRFGGRSPREEIAVTEWLFWQVGGLGPMGGQLSHFVNFATEGNDYARDRYAREYDRLLGVLETRLDGRDFVVDDYSIADMAIFPWLLPYRVFGVDLDAFPNVRLWFDRIKSRPAVQRGVALGRDWDFERHDLTEAERARLFAQTAETMRRAGG